MQNDDFLRSCIEYFGKEKQQVVAIEEMAELTQQLSKFVIDHPKKSREHLVEEYTDVLIMLNQIKIIFEIDDSEVASIREFKIERLRRFIESRRTPLALDGGDSAASKQFPTPEVLSTLQGESTPAPAQVTQSVRRTAEKE